MKVKALFAWIGMLGCIISSAQEITVRVISAKDGHPFVEEPVRLMISRKGARAETAFDQWERTDTEGKAIFHPDVPAQAYVGAVAGVHIQCSPGNYPSAEQILRTGVALNQCRHRPQGKFGLPVHPGEIVIYIGEYSKLELLLYFPWPG
jgi:hypothetical protein